MPLYIVRLRVGLSLLRQEKRRASTGPGAWLFAAMPGCSPAEKGEIRLRNIALTNSLPSAMHPDAVSALRLVRPPRSVSIGPRAHERWNMPYRLSFGIGVVALALSLAPGFPVRAGPGLAVTADEQTADNATACEVQAVPHCGDAAAQYHLGIMFKNGIGVPKDPVAALGWFFCAARSDGQIGIDAARWAEQLSSSLEGPVVAAVRRYLLGCRMLATTAPPTETSEAFERPDTENTPYRKNLDRSLDQFNETFRRFENAGPGRGAPSRRIPAFEPPKIRTQGIAIVPSRRDVWSKVFFLPADGTIVGSQHIAWNLGADDMLRDMREIARDGNDYTLGLLTVFLWALIGKFLLSIGRVLLGPSRNSGAGRLGQRSLNSPWR